MSDTDSLPWEETGAPGLTRKILYTNPASRAQTLLLRSASRPSAAITDRRPQVHPVDEEFLCLAGRFTLEGSHWLTPLTYVYYPPNLVHGFNVDVPDGYEIYLRNSGAVTTERVNAPEHQRPYVINGSAPGGAGTAIIADCAELVHEARQSAQLAVITLRRDAHRGEGACIVCLPAGKHLALELAAPADAAEIFVIEGTIQLGNQAPLPRRGHAVAAGPAALRFAAVDPAVVMLNVRGTSLASAIAQQAGALHECVNAYP